MRIHIWSIGLAGSIDIDRINLTYGDQNKSLISYEFDNSKTFEVEWRPWGDNQKFSISNTKNNLVFKN